MLLLTLLLAAGPALAQRTDPLHSAECRQALADLQVQESAGKAIQPVPDASNAAASAAGLGAARRLVLHRCLGSRLDAPPPQAALRRVQPPTVVPPVSAGGGMPAPLRPPMVPPAGAPPAAVAPPSIVSCDPAGCWASDGSRLTRVGPQLLGPRGLCSPQGLTGCH